MLRSHHTESDRLLALDGLRGLAILLVLVYHFGYVLPPATAAQRAFRAVVDLGSGGVDLFFVLSGFLITRILHDTRGSVHYYRTFYARRALRIFPIYYLWIALTLAVALLLWPTRDETRVLVANQWWLWTYTSNILQAITNTADSNPLYLSASWSLAVEEQFYILWPIVVAVTGNSLPKVCVWLIALAPVCRIVAFTTLGRRGAWFLMPPNVDALALGAWVAVVSRQNGWPSLVRFARRATIIPAVILSAMFAVDPWLVSDGPGRIITESLEPVLFAGALTSAVVWPHEGWAQLGEARWLRWLGSYSYGLYVWHCMVRLCLESLGLHPSTLVQRGTNGFIAVAIFAGIGIPVSIVCAIFSWRFIEAPLLSLKRLFPYERVEDASSFVLTTSLIPADVRVPVDQSTLSIRPVETSLE